jgi:tetratricopeptide (TPR) repeat protein
MPYTRAACPEGIELAKRALSKKGWTRKYLVSQVVLDGDSRDDSEADRPPVSESTVKRFFQGKPIQAAVFGGLCVALELDPDGVEWGAQPAPPSDVATPTVASNPESTLPYLWGLPQNRNRCFTGREELLRDMQTALAKDRRVALAGLGGMGKTQTALEYAYRHLEDYTHIFWVKAEQPDELMADYAAIATNLQLPGYQQTEQPAVAKAFQRWLAAQEGWLLILDNADDVAMVKPWLPVGLRGHLMLTTRAQALGTVAQRLDLKQLLPEDGALLLLRRAKLVAETEALDDADAEDRVVALTLTAELDGLPLALDQAGAYIEEQCLTLAEYLELYQEEKTTLLATRGQLADDHPSVIVTFALAFQKVAEQSAAAADLVRVCAFLAPDDIPEELFTVGAAELGKHLSPAASQKKVLNEALAAATRYSLVSRNRQAKTLAIHRLVQEALRAEINEEGQKRWAERVVNATTETFPRGDYENWPQCQRLITHAEVATQLINKYCVESKTAALLLSRTAFYFEGKGRYNDAEPLFLEALAMRKRLLGNKHPDVATSLNKLASLYHHQGRYSDAEPLSLEALAMNKQLLGDEHPAVATNLNNLAELLRQQGRYSEAEPLYLEALAMDKRLLGDEHPAVATNLNNLALLYNYQGRYSDAEPLFLETLAMDKRLLGDEHPAVATSLHNLALLYHYQERYSDAEPLFLEALAMRKRLFGDEHPDIATSLHNLAKLYHYQGCYSEAEPLYLEALVMDKRLLGDEHPDVATSLNNLAGLYKAQGHYSEAEPLYLEALAIREQRLGEIHPDTVTTQNQLEALRGTRPLQGSPNDLDQAV